MRCAEKVAAAYEQGQRDALAKARACQIVSNALGFKMGLAAGIKDGLDAAREAVEAIPAPYKIRGDFETYAHYSEGKADMKDAALSAIDKLRKS